MNYQIGKFGNYVGEGKYSRSKNPEVYKIWLKVVSKDKNLVYIDPEWMNFQNFAEWYYDNLSGLNPNINYVLDSNVLTWLSDSNLQIYSPDTCCLIPRQIYDNIKCCSKMFQRNCNSKLPIGVELKGNCSYSVNIVTLDKRRISLGSYKTAELAFYVYKYHKEQILKEMADYYYSIGALQEYVYECIYNLPIVSIHVLLNNYNIEKIQNIIEERNNRVSRPIQIIDQKKFHEGSIYNTKFGGPLIVLEYIDKFNVKIKFLDQAGYETIANIDNILAGNVKNPFRLNRYGGYYGTGPYTSVKYMHVYKVWEGVLKRTNTIYNTQDCYSNVIICEEWRNFQNFADWYVKYVSILNPKYKYQIDKDILQWNQEYKIYSPQTCCLIPDELNSSLVGLHLPKNNNLPVGVQINGDKYSPYMTVKDDKKYLGIYDTAEEAFSIYKVNKESYIKELAEKYYNDQAITEDIYKILCSVDIQPF